MIAEILSTGDEVLLGDIIDTNSGFLCEKLKQKGICVNQITAVRDDVDDICGILSQISQRADICLVTGGLGPTQDDLTAMACAKASQQELVLNQKALSSMEIYFKLRGFELTPDNKKQAMIPSCADILVNSHGTAPGFFVQLDRCLFFFMPGVPSEMRQMFDRQVLPQLAQKFGLDQKLFIERLTIFGLPESRVGVLLKGFETRFPEIRLGFRAAFPVIEVKIFMPGGVSGDFAQKSLDLAKQWVIDQLENKVISPRGLSLEQEVGRLLTEKKQTLAIAESCTGGLIANLVTDVAGSSDYFLFSGITYSNEAKIKILNVSRDTLAAHGAVHEQTALEMAEGARLAAGAHWAVSTTGIAGPSGGTAEKPVGTVCIGVSGPGIGLARRYNFTFDDRGKNKKMFAATALELLRRQLAGS